MNHKLKQITIKIDVRDVEDLTKTFWAIVRDMAKKGTETAEFSNNGVNVMIHTEYMEKSMNWTEQTIDGNLCRIYQSRMDD